MAVIFLNVKLLLVILSLVSLGLYSWANNSIRNPSAADLHMTRAEEGDQGGHLDVIYNIV